eukprot:365749-Chlamydomonas_euryale.AAC.3
MIDVRDSQSPNHLWRLCTAPGEDPWKARINLGRLISNILVSQVWALILRKVTHVMSPYLGLPVSGGAAHASLDSCVRVWGVCGGV